MKEFVFDQILNRCQGYNKVRSTHSVQQIIFLLSLEAHGVCSFTSAIAWIITNKKENCGKHSTAACFVLCVLSG